ncbi:MAG: response regulator [Alphaproteobacteria bacterium]
MKVLVVDGDQLFARLMRTKLETWGHKVVVEYDGRSAFERIKREPFRLVIMDWDLPGLTGPELCASIRKLRRQRYTYIIFYTAKSDKDSQMAGLQAGADDYLTKPLNTIELRLRMKNGKRLLNLEDSLREGPGIDTATGVVNGASFRQFFRVVVAEARRTMAEGALLFISIANYREVYQQHGYTPATNLLIEVARLLQKSVRDSDLVARIGEDRYCLLLQNTNTIACRPLIEKLKLQLGALSVYIDDYDIHPEFVLEGLNYPQVDLAAEQILDEVERTPI